MCIHSAAAKNISEGPGCTTELTSNEQHLSIIPAAPLRIVSRAMVQQTVTMLAA